MHIHAYTYVTTSAWLDGTNESGFGLVREDRRVPRDAEFRAKVLTSQFPFAYFSRGAVERKEMSLTKLIA